MVALKEIATYLEQIAPLQLAEDYDNVGLLVGDREAEVSRVLISLDTDEKVVQKAVECGAQLILSHHPLLFRPPKNILKQTSLGRTLYSLIQNNISLYAMHTNFDSVSGGLCDYFLGHTCVATAFDSIEGEFPNGIGRVAKLEKPMYFGELLDRIKKNLAMEQIRYVGDENSIIRTIAVCNGGGADLIYDAYRLGAEVYISGDLKYHHARHAYENKLCLVEGPHYEAEIIFCRYLAKRLTEYFKECCEFVVYENQNPWNVR